MSTPAATPTNNFDVLGPALINVTVMLVLFGFTLIQTYMYYVRYPKDVPRMKLLVTVLLILDTLHVALVCHAQYIKLEVSWDAEKLLDGEWTLYANYAVNLVVCVLVQIHFTRTIYHLCQNRWRLWLTGLLTVLTIAHFGLGMATTVLIFKAWELSKVQAATDITLIPLAAARIASDLVIAISLCVLLHTHRTGVKRTNSVINTLIVYAINRFLLTTAISFIQLVVLSIDLLRLWSFGWSLDFVIGKLYLNSFLASVNSRTHLQDGLMSYHSTSTAINSVRPGDTIRFAHSQAWTESRTEGTISVPMHIHVDTEVRAAEDTEVWEAEQGRKKHGDALTASSGV